METEIVFCERCGVSIPEHEIGASRQASGGRDLCPTCLSPGTTADGDLRLYFCENCRVSIAVSDVLTGSARPEGSGYLCSVCSHGSPAERVARRTAVEREMAANGEAPPAAGSPSPLYFCDACNASIPATAVATGRALVEGGRTWCEACRPRHIRPGRTGGGFVPVLGAALLAAAVTAAGLISWDRMEKERERERTAATRVDPLDSIRREVRAAREDAAAARGEVAERADRLDGALERRVEALRADIRTTREAAEKAVALAATAGSDRAGRIEGRMTDLEAAMEDGFQAMAKSIDRVSAGAGTAGPPLAPPEAPPTEGASAPEVPGEGDGAAPPGPAGDVARAVALLKDVAPEARFAAAIDLGKLGDRSIWPALVEALGGDEDPFVRRACCRSLGELKAYEAFPALVDTLSDGEEYVAKQASMVIREMAGQDFGYKQNQPKGERKKVADRARKWWEENRERLAPGGK